MENDKPTKKTTCCDGELTPFDYSKCGEDFCVPVMRPIKIHINGNAFDENDNYIGKWALDGSGNVIVTHETTQS
jgi:hypothetical protein